MKHVWILNHYAGEPGGIGGTRHFHLADGMRDHGWDATIIASSVELNSGRQRLAAGEMKRLDHRGDVPFLWIRVPKYAGNGTDRIMNMLAYSLRVLWPSYTRDLPRPDVVVGSSVHPLAAFSGALLAKRFKVPFVFEVRDLWPQTLVDLGRISANGFAARVLRCLERWLYRRASQIVVLLPRAADYIVPLGIEPQRISWIPNGVDLSLFPKESNEVREGAGPPTLMYFGAHGSANGLDNVLRAMALLQDRRSAVRLRLIGDGPLKAELQVLAAGLSLGNVSFEPPVAKASIPALAREADMFVFNLVDAPVFKYGISSNKLFDFLAAQRPIIFCCDAANNPVDEAVAGLTVPPGRPEALADAIQALAAMPEAERRAMGENGRHHVELHYGFDKLGAAFASVLDDCVMQARNS